MCEMGGGGLEVEERDGEKREGGREGIAMHMNPNHGCRWEGSE